MLKKLLFGLVGLCATAAIAWGVTLSDGSVTTPVTIYGSTGGVSGAAGVGTENSSSVSNVGILKTQEMIYNGSAGNLVPQSSQGSSGDANTAANMLSSGINAYNGTNYDRLRTMPINGTPGNTGILATAMAFANGANILGVNGITTGSDGISNALSAASVAAFANGFNGTTWDRVRSGAAGDSSASVSATGVLKNQLYIFNSSAGNVAPVASAASNADGNSLGNAISIGNTLYNGASWDRQRGVFETPSASLITLATTSANGVDQTNYNGHGLKCVYDITSFTGTNTILTLQGKDTASGKYYTLLASAALTGTGTTVMTVFPALTAAANTVANDVLPRVWRLITTNTAVTVFAGTVGCTTLL